MTTDDPKINAGQAKQAAKTTIVGGQPPGNQRLLSEVPVGLEQLLAMAAASEDFAQVLQEEPGAAISASGLRITATEQAVLRATPAPMLAKMIARVAEALPRPERRVFLERAAAALAVLVSAVTLGACKDGDKVAQSAKGSGAPKTSPRPTDAQAPMDTVRPMDAMRDPSPEKPPMGHRPDPSPPRPMQRPSDSSMKPSRPVRPPQAGATIERPPPVLKSAGARKDRPMVPSKRPRPKDAPKSRGISHHRQRTRTGIRAGRGDDD